MKLLKQGDPGRKWRSFRRHAVLLFKTVFVGAVITGLWYELWSRGYHFSDDDKDVQIGATITSLGVIYGVFIGWMVTAAKQKYDAVVTAVFEKNKRVYLRYRDERPPIAVHVMIGMLSVPFLGMIGLIAYKHVLMGAMSVFSIAVVLAGFWFVIALLENPTKSAWIDERTPEDWKTADVDAFFHFGA